jgi:Uma2 family endonuclease
MRAALARVRIEATDLDTYPDVSVVCGATQAAGDGLALTNPVLLVEVLSDSTEGYDRGQKAAHYRRISPWNAKRARTEAAGRVRAVSTGVKTIPSLRAYLLVAQHETRLELMVRRNDSWSLIEAGPGERLVIEALAITLDVDEIYAQLDHED